MVVRENRAPGLTVERCVARGRDLPVSLLVSLRGGVAGRSEQLLLVEPGQSHVIPENLLYLQSKGRDRIVRGQLNRPLQLRLAEVKTGTKIGLES
jgi:hypothetical protein